MPMLDKIILVCGILAVIGALPFAVLTELYTKRTDEEDWKSVQEETKARGVAVGEWKELLKRSNS